MSEEFALRCLVGIAVIAAAVVVLWIRYEEREP